MATDLTRVLNMLIPDRWQQYFIENTATLSAIRQAGIVGTIPKLPIPDYGLTMNMPSYQDIDGEDEVWSSGHETIPDPIETQKEIAVVLTRIKSWGAEDLAGILSGANPDPLGAIGRLVGAYWSRREQKTLLAILKGIFGDGVTTGALKDNFLVATSEKISNNLMVDALSILGDASDRLTGFVMHSLVRADLFKKKLLDQKPTEPGTSSPPEFSTYLGRRVIVDDGAPIETVTVGSDSVKVYTTYLFGANTIGYAEGVPTHPVEIERRGTRSEDVLINRRRFIMHPRGLAWKGTAAGTTPSNTELAVATNWDRVFELKNIPIVALQHQIG